MPNNNSITQELETIIRYLRVGDSAEAASRLNICLQNIQQMVRQAHISPDNFKKLLTSMQTIVNQMQLADWVALADVLEYEFVDLLGEISKN